MGDNDKKSAEDLSGVGISFQEDDTLPLVRIAHLEQIAGSYCNALPERTFGYGEYGGKSDKIDLVIKNKYRIVDLIAEGVASNVFLCERVLMGDLVALKILFTELAADPVKSRRFHLEAATTASVKHPNVITVYDFDFTDDGVPFIVTELLRGRTLFGELHREGRLPLSRAIQIITPICSALNVAHARSIVHRDLKPSNIVLHRMEDDTEVVKLIDFGIAKRLLPESAVITSPGIVFGTPGYMSPEHCLGESLDNRSDVYSLGILLFEMLTGHLPFDAETPPKVMLKHVKQTPPSLCSRCPDIPQIVEDIVLRAISKDKEKRFPTALALAEELNRVI